MSDWARLYPFGSHYARIGCSRMHYVDEGTGDALLMVHGNPTWSFHFRNLILALRSQYRAIAVDHLGCGLSDKSGSMDFDLAHHTDNLVNFVQSLDLKRVTLLAQDWGGAIGLGAALALPDRFERIVLFNTGAFPPRSIPWRLRFCRNPLVGRLAVQGANLFLRAALRMAVQDGRCMTSPVRAGYRAPYKTWPDRYSIYRFVRDIPTSRRHLTYRLLEELEAKLPQLANRPSLLIWGMRDWCFTPDCLDRFQQLLPQSEVFELPNVGHWVVEEATDQIVPRLTKFLADHPLQSDDN